MSFSGVKAYYSYGLSPRDPSLLILYFVFRSDRNSLLIPRCSAGGVRGFSSPQVYLNHQFILPTFFFTTRLSKGSLSAGCLLNENESHSSKDKKDDAPVLAK